MIKKIFFAFILGFLITACWLPYDPILKQWVGHGFCKALEQALECKIVCAIERVDFWHPTVILANVTVVPLESAIQWQWSAQNYSTSFSWWYLIYHKILNLDIRLNKIEVKSDLTNGSLAILPHLKKMALGNPTIPLAINSLVLQEAKFTVTDPGNKHVIHLAWNSQTIKRNSTLYSNLHIVDALLTCYNKSIFQSLQATSSIAITECSSESLIDLKANGTAIINLFNNPKKCEVTANWQEQKGTFCLHSKDLTTCDSYTIDGQWNNQDTRGLIKISHDSTPLGECTLHNTFSGIEANGIFQKNPFYALIKNNHGYYLDELLIKNEDATTVLSCSSTSENKYEGHGEIALDFIGHTLGYPLATNSFLKYRIALKNADIEFNLDALSQPIYIPQYNCIKNAQAYIKILLQEKKALIETASLAFLQGHVEIHNGSIIYNQNYKMPTLFLPLEIYHYRATLSKDNWLGISGTALATYDSSKSFALSAQLFLDEGKLAYNFFAPAVMPFFAFNISDDQKKEDIKLDITIDSKKPITLTTTVFDTKAKIQLHLKNTLSNPQITGTIIADGGNIKFPYKPLFITKGLISFEGKLAKPRIELVAQNTIHNYDIRLHVSGLFPDPIIAFHSNPSLTDNQIISLLLAGSHSPTLNTTVPAVLAEGLKSYLVNSNTTLSKLCYGAKQWLAPFRFVHLVPLLNDQSARGGLRAAFEIEYGDRLKALLQKNFSLTEDTRLEVEYAISDSTSLKVVRDERRDINGQMEMHWKF